MPAVSPGILDNLDHLDALDLGITGDTPPSMATATPIRAERRSSPTPKSSSALKSILRSGPSSLGRRTREEDDEEPQPESPPSKRRKTVSFDMESNIVQNIGIETPAETKKKADEIKRVVLKALKENTHGDQEGYDTLKGIFENDRRRKPTPNSTQSEDEVDPRDLIHYVNALQACAPQLGRSCSGLVHGALSIPWLGRPEDFVTAYIDFLANLVTGQSLYLSNVLAMLVEKFRCFKPSQWAAGDYPEVDCDVMRRRLHKAVGHVLQLFPAARRVLLSLINKEFPFSDESHTIHVAFVQNLLRLREYAPDMGPEIMELITDRLVKVGILCPPSRRDFRLHQSRSTCRSKLTSMRLTTISLPELSSSFNPPEAMTTITTTTLATSRVSRVTKVTIVTSSLVGSSRRRSIYRRWTTS